MTIYFHESLDPVREAGAHTRYLAELGEIVHTEGNARGSAGGRCVAAWVPVFLTGHWPQIITFWEMSGGWDGFAAHVDGNPALFHEPLERWYGERSGGFDRVLLPTEYTPTLDELLSQEIRAPVVAQHTVTVPPGGAEKYLHQLGEARQRIGTKHGFSVLGAYEVAFRQGAEVIELWAFPDMATLAATQSQPERFPELAQWVEQAQRLETSHTGLVLRPARWSPLR